MKRVGLKVRFPSRWDVCPDKIEGTTYFLEGNYLTLMTYKVMADPDDPTNEFEEENWVGMWSWSVFEAGLDDAIFNGKCRTRRLAKAAALKAVRRWRPSCRFIREFIESRKIDIPDTREPAPLWLRDLFKIYLAQWRRTDAS